LPADSLQVEQIGGGMFFPDIFLIQAPLKTVFSSSGTAWPFAISEPFRFYPTSMFLAKRIVDFTLAAKSPSFRHVCSRNPGSLQDAG
jgi:hypothetical protein